MTDDELVRLIAESRPHVRALARQLAGRDWGLADDVESVLRLHYVIAARKFDGSRGSTFCLYADAFAVPEARRFLYHERRRGVRYWDRPVGELWAGADYLNVLVVPPPPPEPDPIPPDLWDRARHALTANQWAVVDAVYGQGVPPAELARWMGRTRQLVSATLITACRKLAREFRTKP